MSINLGAKICTTLVQKCDDRVIVITDNLEFRKFSLTIIYKKIFEIFVHYAKQVPTVTSN